jgi:hypothetical protein
MSWSSRTAVMSLLLFLMLTTLGCGVPADPPAGRAPIAHGYNVTTSNVTVRFAAGSVSEGAAASLVLTRTGSINAVSIGLIVSATATSGSDYPALPTYVSMGFAQSTVTIPVSTIDDVIVEGDETLVVAAVKTQYVSQIGSPATLTIVDNDVQLIGEWKFNEGAGTGTADSSGLGHSASLHNAPAWVSGYAGTALAFTRTAAQPQFVEVGDASKAAFDFKAGQQMTIAARVLATSLAANDYDIIAAKGRDGGSRNWLFELKGTGVGGAPGVLGFYYTDASGAGHGYTTASSPIAAGVWVHVAMTLTFGVPSSTRMYVNGMPFAGSWIQGTGAAAPALNTVAPTFGDEYEAAPGSTINERFDGAIDDLRIYRGTLSPAPVLALAAAANG